MLTKWKLIVVVIYFWNLVFHPNLNDSLETHKFIFSILNNMNYIGAHAAHVILVSQPREPNISHKYRIMNGTSLSLKCFLLNTFLIIHLIKIYSKYCEYQTLKGHYDLWETSAFL